MGYIHVVYAGVLVTVLCLVLAQDAYASNVQVVITNGTNHCNPNPSCYVPYNVNVLVGDTITWVNHDNKTHTATTGTTNYGPQGIFDSGDIPAGGSFTQFFGSTGRYSYYDKSDMWPSGVITVSKETLHAELSWVNGSLKIENQNYTSNGIVISKMIQNTGNADANSIIFTLKIKNQTSDLLYNGLVKLDVPAGKSVPVTFAWDGNMTSAGQYQLYFEANSANTIGDMNANDDRSTEIITIRPSAPKSSPPPIAQQNYTLAGSGYDASVPEFGPISYGILVVSVVSVVIMTGLKSRLFA